MRASGYNACLQECTKRASKCRQSRVLLLDLQVFSFLNLLYCIWVNCGFLNPALPDETRRIHVNTTTKEFPYVEHCKTLLGILCGARCEHYRNGAVNYHGRNRRRGYKSKQGGCFRGGRDCPQRRDEQRRFLDY